MARAVGAVGERAVCTEELAGAFGGYAGFACLTLTLFRDGRHVYSFLYSLISVILDIAYCTETPSVLFVLFCEVCDDLFSLGSRRHGPVTSALSARTQRRLVHENRAPFVSTRKHMKPQKQLPLIPSISSYLTPCIYLILRRFPWWV
jgi:hypothetical protein